MVDILERCKPPGLSKTRIMYGCGVNTKLIDKYLACLVQNELLETNVEKRIDNGGHVRQAVVVYSTTQRGMVFILTFQNLEQMLRRVLIAVP